MSRATQDVIADTCGKPGCVGPLDAILAANGKPMGFRCRHCGAHHGLDRRLIRQRGRGGE